MTPEPARSMALKIAAWKLRLRSQQYDSRVEARIILECPTSFNYQPEDDDKEIEASGTRVSCPSQAHARVLEIAKDWWC
ncbi:hypothetical protein DKX38_003003 [Salix brachista]|uniref:Uncharacterized protein n=1 Tax=Salix brachista TaxID=2182728 RepID=A0A5N5NNM5_9ROSI|nr:hypothetical protein DKX38_003003 [Salix brachista]